MKKKPLKQSAKIVQLDSNSNSLKLILGKKSYQVDYPFNLNRALSIKSQMALMDNYAYALSLPLVFFGVNSVQIQGYRPVCEKFIHYGIEKDLPRASLESGLSLKTLRDQFHDHQAGITCVQKDSQSVLPLHPTNKTKALLSISFGRDSLLSYGVAKEIGLKCDLAFVEDRALAGYNRGEYKFKQKTVKEFLKQEKTALMSIKDDTDNIFYDQKGSALVKDFTAGMNALFVYALEMIPAAYHFGDKYLIFGNEYDFNAFHINRGEKVYSSVDQSTQYMERENAALKKLTDGNIQVVSLIEPLYGIAEYQVLFRRYPHLLKHIMSCASDHITTSRWCGRCPICAWGFICIWACGGRPADIGMKDDLFAAKHKDLYLLFRKKIERLFDRTDSAFEQQLLAFYLAIKNGAQGDLVDLFKQRYWAQAEKRARELRRKYFGVYPAPSIPVELRGKVNHIYHQVLDKLI